MPKIIGLAEQQAAVKKIRAILKDLSVTKTFLDAANVSGEYTITFKGSDNHVYSTTVYAEEKNLVDALAEAYRQRMADEVLALAQQNRIELDPEEKVLLGIYEPD